MITPGTLFIILTAAILVLIMVVIFIEKILSTKRSEAVQAPEYSTTAELDALKSSKLEPKELLDKIDLLAKKTLWTNLGVEDSPDYSQLAEMSAEKPHIAEFCSEMAKTLYAGQNVSASDAKRLLRSLEETLKEEGKIVLVEQKHKEIEENKFFLDAWIEKMASIVSRKIQNTADNSSVNETPVTVESSPTINNQNQDSEVKEINPAEELKKLKTKLIPPVSHPISRAKKKKENKEYQYIESVDVLDRIQNKLRSRQQKALS